VTYDGLRGGYPTFTVSSPTDSFQVWFAAPAGSPLTTGTYNNAQRFDFRAPGTPGLDVFGDGRGCNTVSGSFTVYDATYNGAGDVLSFAAQFTDHCEGGGPALLGSLSYNSSVVMPTWLATSTSSLSFGAVRVGDSPAPKTISMVNLGGAADVTGFGLSGVGQDDFIGGTNCEQVLSTGQSCSISMVFLPGEPGPRYATLTPQGVGSPPQIALSGTGTVGYYQADSNGDVFPFGDAKFYGDMGFAPLNAPMVSLAVTADGYGYWLLGADGGVFSFGDARFFGSTGNLHLNRPVVAMVSTPDGGGYWFVASDGGIFAFGNARFHGSMGGHRLNSPIVGMATTPDGKGYWLVAADGGMFSFGDAKFFGSMGGRPLNSPIVGMAPTPDGWGYWLVAADGGMFTFGDARFHGSMGGHPLNSPIVGMAPTWDGNGYWLTAFDGGVFNFGDAPFFGAPTGPGSAGGIAIAGTAPFTVQATLDVPGLRHGRMALPGGWSRIGAAAR
jgi:hypothetical protein